jgi:hypothetical protein
MAIPVSSFAYHSRSTDFVAMYDWNPHGSRTGISSLDNSCKTIRAKSCDCGEWRRDLLDRRSKGRPFISSYRPNQDGSTSCRA